MPGLFDDILGPSVVEAPAISQPAPRKRRRALSSDAVASIEPPSTVDPFNFLPPSPRVVEPEPVAPTPEPEIEVEPDEPGVLGTIGRWFDAPGRFIRQGITGKADASGRDVLRTLGWENDEKEGFLTPAGIAGFGTELLLDPLNFLPGFMGIKAATKAGKAAALVGGHLDDADKAFKGAKWAKNALAQKADALAKAGGVVDEASLLAEKAALPQAKTDLFGDILGAGGKQAPDAELVQRIAGRDNAVGAAAKTLVDSGAQTFRPLADAGERVKAGQEALLSVGGEYDPLGLFRLGGKYNPINYLPEIPVLTAPVQLPQKTLIEGAGAAQKIQDIGRGIGELPGIKQAKALFSKVPGAPLASQEALQQMAKDSRTEVRAGGAAAEDAARAFDQEVKGLGPVDMPLPGLKPADIDVMDTPGATLFGDEWVDPMTGKVLGPGMAKDVPAPFEVPPLDPKTQGMLDEELNPTKYPIGFESATLPKLPPGAPENTNVPKGWRAVPLEDFDGMPVYEDFERAKKGQHVRFNPRNALSNTAGLRKPMTAKIEQVFDFQGQTIAQLEGGWHVPLDKVQRPAANIRKDYQGALDLYERERQWKGKTPQEIKRLKERARDSRAALEQSTNTGEMMGMELNAALKGDRNDILAQLGMKYTGDLEQAQALPKVLEQALQKGSTPQLKTIDYLDLESGALGVGDKIKLAGDTFTLKGLDPETGLVHLQDGIPIYVPMDRIPMDKGSAIQRAADDAELARRAESFDPLQALAGTAKVTGPSPKIAKLNKAADVLAGAESKLNVKPFERPEDLPDFAKSAIPDMTNDMLNRVPASSSIGEASNPSMRDFAEGRVEAAGRAADDAERARIKAMQDAGATTSGELNDAGKLKFEGGETLSPDALSRVKGLDKNVRQAENTARAATVLAGASEDIAAAGKQATQMMAGRSMDAGSAITEALETGAAAPKEIAGIVDRTRGRYEEMLKLEEGITPALVDDRVKYVTHVLTEAGTKFFRSISKNKAQQAQLFVELEKKRIAAGLKANNDNLTRADDLMRAGEEIPADLKAEIAAGRAKAKHRAGPTSRPVPESVKAEWDKTLATMDPQVRQFIQDNGLVKEYLAFGKDISLEHGSQIPRLKQYKGLTVSELNDAMGKFGARGPVYNPNPAAQLFTREMRHAKVMAGKSFLDNVAQQFGRPDANIPDVMKSLADDTISPEGFRQAMGIEDPQTAKAAFDTLKRMTDEEELGALVDGFDKITRAWKGWITRGFPAYHVRNHIGNRLQAWLTGVPLAGEHVQLGHKLVGGVDFKVKLGEGKIVDRDALLKEMQQTGTLKGGFFESNLKEALDETANKWNPLNPDNALIGAAERFSAGVGGGLNQVLAGNAKGALKMDGNAIEGADRASTYLFWRQKGFSPRAAAEKVDQALFDYSKENLSPFEQKYMNRAVFFYGYMRNVLPFMLGALGENGAKVGQMLKLGTQPGRPDFVPEYAAAGLQLPLGTDAEGNSKMAYSLGTPVESAVEPFAQNPLTMLNPFFKMPLEMASGRDFFLGKDIQDAKKAPNWVDNAPEFIQELLGTVKSKTKTGGQRVEMDPNIAYAMRNNPFSRIGTTASKIFDERKDPLDILQNLGTGARVVSIDDEEEKKWRIKDRAKERLKELAKEGRAKVGKYESFGRAGDAKKGADAEVDNLLALLR